MDEKTQQHKPHPENVPGDFYVEDGCCTMCEAPFPLAPAMFGVIKDANGHEHCYIRRQPNGSDEIYQMIDAISVAELDCIRYRGTDRLVQLKIVTNGNGTVCDALPPDLQRETERLESKRDDYGMRKQRPWWRFW